MKYCLQASFVSDHMHSVEAHCHTSCHPAALLLTQGGTQGVTIRGLEKPAQGGLVILGVVFKVHLVIATLPPNPSSSCACPSAW